MSEFPHIHTGRCDCGAVRYRFHSQLAENDLSPRACQCQFCRPRAASYLSDPRGRLEIEVRDKRYLYAHVFGTATADFVHCGRCNHLVYVSCEIDGRTYGLVVQSSLDAEIDPGRGRAANFADESLPERLARRAETWIPDVQVRENSEGSDT